jgi:hypothetical protein
MIPFEWMKQISTDMHVPRICFSFSWGRVPDPPTVGRAVRRHHGFSMAGGRLVGQVIGLS